MSNLKENLIKAGLMLLGGGLLYYAFRPSANGGTAKNTATNTAAASTTTGFDSESSSKVEPTMENAEIVAEAYSNAVLNGEPPSKLTELNQECMKEFGMRCYVKDNRLIVCDVSGNTVLTK
jgi:hypothetical protein